MNKLLFFLLIGLLTCLSSCCEEGCTDPDACNYDSEADDDDGSCNYGCLTQVEPECVNGELMYYDILSSVDINCFDTQSGSPYYNQVFSLLNITQERYQTCIDGFFELNGYAENIIEFQNVTSMTITFAYEIIQNANGQIKEYQGYVSNLPAGETYQVNTGDNTFINFNGSVVNVYFGNISYQ